MKWPALLAAVFDELRGSAILGAIFGPQITDAEEKDFRAPCLRVNLISNVETENYETVYLQIDVWTRSKPDQIIAESELRRLFHRETPYVIQGVGTWSQYQGRNRLEGPQDGILGVAVDYRFEPLRSRYTPTPES
jgi:hypothetical protein